MARKKYVGEASQYNRFEDNTVQYTDDLDRARVYMEKNRRPRSQMYWQDPLHVPEEIQPDGWRYYWVRESTLNDPSFSRLTAARRDGWQIVPASRHPELCFNDPFGRSAHLEGCIHRGGVVLCEKPKQWIEEDREDYDAYNRELVGTMEGLNNFLGDRLFPVSKNQSYSERGQGMRQAPKDNGHDGRRSVW